MKQMSESLKGDMVGELISKWHGANVQIWQYQLSHRRMEIRLIVVGEYRHLRIIVDSCQYICGPFKWNANVLELSRYFDSELLMNIYVLKDSSVNFQLSCGGIAAIEVLGKLTE